MGPIARPKSGLGTHRGRVTLGQSTGMNGFATRCYPCVKEPLFPAQR